MKTILPEDHCVNILKKNFIKEVNGGKVNLATKLEIDKVLELLLTTGARLAEPGEFTKRAFLNGRIDLTEAEGIMNLIEAKSEYVGYILDGNKKIDKVG